MLADRRAAWHRRLWGQLRETLPEQKEGIRPRRPSSPRSGPGGEGVCREKRGSRFEGRDRNKMSLIRELRVRLQGKVPLITFAGALKEAAPNAQSGPRSRRRHIICYGRKDPSIPYYGSRGGPRNRATGRGHALERPTSGNGLCGETVPWAGEKVLRRMGRKKLRTWVKAMRAEKKGGRGSGSQEGARTQGDAASHGDGPKQVRASRGRRRRQQASWQRVGMSRAVDETETRPASGR